MTCMPLWGVVLFYLSFDHFTIYENHLMIWSVFFSGTILHHVLSDDIAFIWIEIFVILLISTLALTTFKSNLL